MRVSTALELGVLLILVNVIVTLSSVCVMMVDHRVSKVAFHPTIMTKHSPFITR